MSMGLRESRCEWRQPLLILALISVTVAATVVGSAVAIATPTPATAAFGIAAIGFPRTNRLDQLSVLQNIPAAGLLWILVGLPLIAVTVSLLLAGREQSAISRQPLE
jgi:hypothetical protein